MGLALELAGKGESVRSIISGGGARGGMGVWRPSGRFESRGDLVPEWTLDGRPRAAPDKTLGRDLLRSAFWLIIIRERVGKAVALGRFLTCEASERTSEEECRRTWRSFC